jgi:hypothetical protein
MFQHNGLAGRGRLVALSVGLGAVIATLPACATGSGSRPMAGTHTVPAGADGPGGTVSPGAGPTAGSGGGTAGTGQGAGGSGHGSAPAGAGVIVLREGVEHDVCGIGVAVKFIPPSAFNDGPTAGATYEAVLVGGPVGQAADQPTPAGVAPARPGLTVTVAGRRFLIRSVNATGRWVEVEALC